MIFRAPEGDLAIPEIGLTQFLLERVPGREKKPALIDGPTGRTLTYGEWAESVRRVAAGLAARGFKKGDVFAIYSPNVPEYAVVFHAVSLIGGVNTTINPLYTPAEVAQQLRDCSAKYLITVPPCAERAMEAVRDTTVLEVFVFGEAPGTTPFSALLGDGDPPDVPINPREDLVALPYSSGTTGLPKGVMLTHHNLVANLVQACGVLAQDEHDTILGVLPFFHIYGMTVIMNLGLYHGVTIVTMPRFDLEQCLTICEKYRVTFANVVPPIVLALGLLGVVGSGALTWAAVATAANLVWWLLVYAWLRLSPVYALLHPLGAAMVLYIALGAIVRGRRVRWKEREYRAA